MCHENDAPANGDLDSFKLQAFIRAGKALFDAKHAAANHTLRSRIDTPLAGAAS
jgi:hypothetical protein